MTNQTTITIQGMTCGHCVSTVETNLNSINNVISATVTLDPPQATVKHEGDINLKQLNKLISPYVASDLIKQVNPDVKRQNAGTYFPLFLIVVFIALVTLLAQYPLDSFKPSLWMRHFMSGFFIVFSFFKLLNIKGFAQSFAMYDVIAKRWFSWGYLYPFLELCLGLLFLIGFSPMLTNWATIVLLGIGTIGVIQSNLSNKQIQCACLGDVFDLPMSKITIIENVTMILMAIWMLV